MRDCFGPVELRTRDWRTIWAFKDRLRRGSEYKVALAMDRGLAERIVELEDEARENGDEDEFASDEPPTPSGYTLDTYLLLSIVDALQGVQAAVIAAAGADPPSMNPMPRPQTALDVVRDERRLVRMNSLIDEFTSPDKTDGDGLSWFGA